MTAEPRQNAPAFSIQQAKAEHAPLIRRLIQEVGISPKGLDWQRFLVAISPAGEFVGCGQIKSHTDGTQELASIAVKPEWRGRGVARALIEALLASRPDEDLYLMTEAGLRPMYAKFGFREISPGGMPTYFRRLMSLPDFLEMWQPEGLIPIVMHRAANA